MTSETLSRFDMIAYGNVIKKWAFDLSNRINHQIITPISQWLDDPDMLKRWQVLEDSGYDWAKLKREQRSFDRSVQAEKLKLWNEHQRQLKAFRKDAAAIIGSLKECPSNPNTQLRNYSNTQSNIQIPNELFIPFSPYEQHRQVTLQTFQKAQGQPIISLIPWREILIKHLFTPHTRAHTHAHTHAHNMHNQQNKTNPNIPKKLSELPAYLNNPKQDLAGKFIHLLQLESEGTINLSQDTHCGEIEITPLHEPKNKSDQSITITNQDGQTKSISTINLSDDQINGIIAQIQNNEILISR